MMGLPNWLHWVGWFSITLLISIITISVMVMVIVLGRIFENVDPFIIFVSLFLYGFSTICFNFAQSTVFSNRESTLYTQSIIFHQSTQRIENFIN